MSRELRRAFVDMRDARRRAAKLGGQVDISTEQVFSSPDGSILDPDKYRLRTAVGAEVQR